MRKLVFFLFLCLMVYLTVKRPANHHVSFNTLLNYNIEALAAGEGTNMYKCLGSDL